MKIQQAQTFVPCQKTAAQQSQAPVNPEPSELDTLIGPEPHIDGNALIKPILKGAAIGAGVGAIIGLGTRHGYSAIGDIPTAARAHFGGLLAGTAVGAVTLGRGIEPAFDRPTSAVMGSLAGLTFTLVTSTLGLVQSPAAAIAAGAGMGAFLGLTGGLLHSQEQSQSQAVGGSK